jgi:hypothetical protein
MRSPKLSSQHNAIVVIHSVNRKNMLGRVNRNPFKFHLGGPSLKSFDDPMMAHPMP